MTTAKLKADWILKHIGNIGVDSGFVRMSDTAGNPSVTSETAEIDGIYPVFHIFDGERVIGLFISFVDAPPMEVDGKVTLGNLEE